MELESISLNIPEECNVILGQSHFIKTVEDLYEIMVTNIPNAKFGLAFSEASGPCLIRTEGTDKTLIKIAVNAISDLASGHSFIIVMQDAFPINVLNAIKHCSEVVSIFCATANPIQAIVAKTEQGNGILGIIDGFAPKGIESDNDKNNRNKFLRTIGYKR